MLILTWCHCRRYQSDSSTPEVAPPEIFKILSKFHQDEQKFLLLDTLQIHTFPTVQSGGSSGCDWRPYLITQGSQRHHSPTRRWRPLGSFFRLFKQLPTLAAIEPESLYYSYWRQSDVLPVPVLRPSDFTVDPGWPRSTASSILQSRLWWEFCRLVKGGGAAGGGGGKPAL